MGTDPLFCDYRWDGGAHLHECTGVAHHKGPHACLRCGTVRDEHSPIADVLRALEAERFSTPGGDT